MLTQQAHSQDADKSSPVTFAQIPSILFQGIYWVIYNLVSVAINAGCYLVINGICLTWSILRSIITAGLSLTKAMSTLMTIAALLIFCISLLALSVVLWITVDMMIKLEKLLFITLDVLVAVSAKLGYFCYITLGTLIKTG